MEFSNIWDCKALEVFSTERTGFCTFCFLPKKKQKDIPAWEDEQKRVWSSFLRWFFGIWDSGDLSFRLHDLPSLKLTAKAPENGWLEYDRFLLGPGAFAVSFREAITFCRCQLSTSRLRAKKVFPWWSQIRSNKLIADHMDFVVVGQLRECAKTSLLGKKTCSLACLYGFKKNDWMFSLVLGNPTEISSHSDMTWSHGKLEIRCHRPVPFSKERLEEVMEEHERVLEALQTPNVPSSKVPLKFESLTEKGALFARKNLPKICPLLGTSPYPGSTKHFGVNDFGNFPRKGYVSVPWRVSKND